MTLRLGDGTVAEGAGQIVVTGQRLIGMITDGTVGKAALKEIAGAGSVYAFAFDWDDCDPVEIQKNWRGKPVSGRIMSKEGQSPVFGIQVIMVSFLVKDDGQVTQTSFPAFLDQLTSESQRNLQKEI